MACLSTIGVQIEEVKQRINFTNYSKMNRTVGGGLANSVGEPLRKIDFNRPVFIQLCTRNLFVLVGIKNGRC